MPGVNRSASLLEGLLDPKFAGEPDRSRRCEFALLSPATRCSRLRRAGSPEPEAGEAEVGDAEVTPNDDADDIFQATPPAPAPHPSSCPRRPRSFAKVFFAMKGGSVDHRRGRTKFLPTNSTVMYPVREPAGDTGIKESDIWCQSTFKDSKKYFDIL